MHKRSAPPSVRGSSAKLPESDLAPQPGRRVAPAPTAPWRGFERLEPRLLLSALPTLDPSPLTADPSLATSTTLAASTATVGDANSDGRVNSLDIAAFTRSVTGAVAPGSDVNGDGSVNALDWVQFTSALITSILAPQPAVNVSLPMGMNLSAVTDWNREWPFVDVMKHSRAWIPTDASGNWTGKAGTAPVDANGWPVLAPGTGAATLMLREIDGHYPAGVYICTFEGDGDLAFKFATATRVSANRYKVAVTPSDNGIELAVLRSNPADPVKNIRVWMPGFENAASPFHPLFVERLRPFSVIRFMDWQHTNGSKLVTWADRAKTTDAQQSSDKGVAYEYIIALCNEVDADPWICVPHQADENYIRQMATMFREGLKPGLKVYVEYSNEIWNTGFAVNKYLGDLPGTWLEAAGRREATTFRIWGEVFAQQPQRLVRVVAGQKNNLWMTGEIVKAVIAAGGQFEAVSCSGYIGPGSASTGYDANTTPADILADTHAYTITDNLTNQIAGHAELARRYGKRFVVYEGGQHISLDGSSSKPYTDAYYAVQSDPGMYTAYQEMLAGFRDLGGDLYCAYNYVGQRDSQYGSWGHLEYQDQPLDQAPKYAAAVNATLGVLDGDPAQMTYSLTATFNPSADVNGDGLVNGLDILGFVRSITTDPLAADANGDGLVNALDMAPFVAAITTSALGA